MKTLRDIEADVARLALRIGASPQNLPSYGFSLDFGHTHIEVDNCLYHYLAFERGVEVMRHSTASYDELLYWIFKDVTHRLAYAHELNNRIDDQDCRRIAFPKQIEIMAEISPAMSKRLEDDIADILRWFPYRPAKAVGRL